MIRFLTEMTITDKYIEKLESEIEWHNSNSFEISLKTKGESREIHDKVMKVLENEYKKKMSNLNYFEFILFKLYSMFKS